MKKVTYKGLLYSVEDSTQNQFKLSGLGWVEKKDTASHLTGFMYKIFGVKFKNEMK